MLHPRYPKNEYDPIVNQKIGIIVKIEMEIMESVRNGHRAHWGDQFKDKRNEAEKLRREIGLR